MKQDPKFADTKTTTAKHQQPLDKREIAREVHTHGSRNADAPKDQSGK